MVVLSLLSFGVFGILSYIQYSAVFSPKPYFSGGKIQYSDTSRTFVGREYPADRNVFRNHNSTTQMAIEWQIALGSALISILGYIVYTNHTQGKDVVKLQTNMQSIQFDLAEIRNGQKELDNKVNLFLKTEIDTMKEIMRARHNGA